MSVRAIGWERFRHLHFFLEHLVTVPLEAEGRLQEVGDVLLTRDAIEFLNALHRCFGLRRRELLDERIRRQKQIDLGEVPDFQEAKQRASAADWKVKPVHTDLAWRQTMVTAPPTWSALTRGLESDAKTAVADFDDHLSHTWANCLTAHATLRDLLRSQPLAKNARSVGQPRSQPRERRRAVILRPRNWSLEEKHFPADGRAASASLFDFGLYAYHFAAASGAEDPELYVSLPKIESFREARLWDDVFAYAEDYLSLSPGAIRAAITIDTVPAAFQMEAILFELREHAWALECAPANYLASFAKTFRAHAHALLPQRSDITMDQPFLHAYQELLVHTSHARGARALSAAFSQLPPREDWEKNPWARANVRRSAKRELEMGFDGFSVADAAFVPMVVSACREQARNPAPSGDEKRSCYITAGDLTARAHGRITIEAVRENVATALDCLEAWLAARDSAQNERRESMAMAELCRAQLWQWVRHSARLSSGSRVDGRLVECLIRDRLAATESRVGAVEFAASKFSTAAELLLRACMDGFDSLLAVRAYAHLG